MMRNWIIVEVNDNGDKMALEGEFTTWEDACRVQENLEEMNPDKCYLLYTCDEWMYECECGRA